MTTTATTTAIPADLLALAKSLVEANEKANIAYSNYTFAVQTASKTPTGRNTKASQKVIDIAEQAREVADKAESAIETPFREALYAFDLNVFSAERRKRNLAAIQALLPEGFADVTSLYHARYEEAFAGKSNVRKNTYGDNILVFDITPYGVGEGKPFRKVKSYNRSYRWTEDNSVPEYEENDWHVHLKVYITESGFISGLYIHYGHHVPLDAKHPSDKVLSHGHSIDVDRNHRDLSISSFNGSSSELRVWSALLSITADLTESYASLRKVNRPDYHERVQYIDHAKALLEGRVL